MNRAERRRQQRAEARNKPPVLVAGDGVVAAALGQSFEARPAAKLRPKVAGQHRWVATGAWVLRDIDAANAMDPDIPKLLDNENLMHLSIGCWDCEQPIGVIQPGSVCPAEGED